MISGRRGLPVMLIGVAAIGLSGCQISASGQGVVTITSDIPATAYAVDAGTGLATGDVLDLCAPDAATCGPGDHVLFTVFPAAGQTSVVLTAGTPVHDNGGTISDLPDPSAPIVSLPAGAYAVAAQAFFTNCDTPVCPPNPFVQHHLAIGQQGIGNSPLIITVDNTQPQDLSIQLQSIGRLSADSACPTGWDPSWQQWPNSETGGWVCNKQTYRYYPWLAVPSGQ